MKNWLVIDNLSKTFKQQQYFWQRQKGQPTGISNLTCHLSANIVGILGESGSGKTTLIRLIAGIDQPDKSSGQISWNLDIPETEHQLVSVIFQDYTTAINPHFTVREALAESLTNSLISTTQETILVEILEKVGLDSACLNKVAQQLSGGQIQRVCIARSLLSQAKVLIFDEAFSSLDLLNIDKILDVLVALREEFQLRYIFVTHDLELATYFCDQILFLRDGRLEEVVETTSLMQASSPYVQALIDAQI